MNQWMKWMGAVLLGGLCLLGVAYAQYESAYQKEKTPYEGEDSFARSVDLKRFRKGNIDWDTQELIASGLTALHQEHEKVLRELREVKAALRRLEGQR